MWWGWAKASCSTLLNYRRALLAQETPQGAKDMMNTSPEHWPRAFFKLGSNCDSIDNNMCESYNHSIMDARFYPVISMLEAFRKKRMDLRSKRKKTEDARFIWGTKLVHACISNYKVCHAHMLLVLCTRHQNNWMST